MKGSETMYEMWQAWQPKGEHPWPLHSQKTLFALYWRTQFTLKCCFLVEHFHPLGVAPPAPKQKNASCSFHRLFPAAAMTSNERWLVCRRRIVCVTCLGSWRPKDTSVTSCATDDESFSRLPGTALEMLCGSSIYMADAYIDCCYIWSICDDGRRFSGRSARKDTHSLGGLVATKRVRK